jgi:creatinine amidohydrolase/Fe(II)-dependent formamide hydrolase-like protein
VRGCGGHWAVPGALWDLKAEARRTHVDATLRVISVSDGWGEIQQEVFGESEGGHAAVMETALALGGRADLVQMDRMRAPTLRLLNERYRAGGEVFLFDEITDTGALGDPSPATVEGGEHAWQLIVERLAERLRFFDEQDRALGRL